VIGAAAASRPRLGNGAARVGKRSFLLPPLLIGPAGRAEPQSSLPFRISANVDPVVLHAAVRGRIGVAAAGTFERASIVTENAP
jgi:hypothetical protein